MSGTQVDLSLVVKAVDKATGPLRAMTSRLAAMTAPFKSFGKDLAKFGEAANFGAISDGFKNFGGALRNVGSEVFALGARLAAMAAAAGFAFYGIIKGAVESGDKLAEISDRVGLTVDTFASLQYAARQADVDQEAFNSALDRFNKNLGEVKSGKGEFLEFLKRVSPALLAQVKAAHGTEEALSLMTDAFKRINDPAKSAALSAAAFGKSGLQMGRFLHQGSAAIQAAQRRYMELSGSQEQFARNASDLDNALKDNETAFLGLRNAMAGAFFPALTMLSRLVTDFMVKHRDSLKQWAESVAGALQRWLDGGGFERLVANLGKVADAIGKVVDWVGPWGVGLAAAAALAAPLIASLGSLSVAFVSLAVSMAPLLVASAPLLLLGVAVAAIAVGAFAMGYAGVRLFHAWKPVNDLFAQFRVTLGSVLEAIQPLLGPVGTLLRVAGIQTGFITQGRTGILADEKRADFRAPASLGVSPVAPLASQTSRAEVSVSFDNLPKGARVSTEPSNSQPVDLSLGYASGD